MGWGGKRAGAGRKRTSLRVPHERRPAIERRATPVEITLKLRRSAPGLGGREALQAFRRGCLRARRFGLRIIEYRLRRREIVLFCEFKKRSELERSFKSLNTTLAIALKRRAERRTGRRHRGAVFLDRYHLSLLDSPLAVKLSRERILASRDGAGKRYSLSRLSSMGGAEMAGQVCASPQFWLSRMGWTGG